MLFILIKFDVSYRTFAGEAEIFVYSSHLGCMNAGC